MQALGYRVELTEKAKDFVADKGYDPKYGARPLKRAIQQQIENPLSKAILSGRFGPKDTIHVGVNGSELTFGEAPTVELAK